MPWLSALTRSCLTLLVHLSYMSVSYTLRLPDDLKRQIDFAAKSGGVSPAQLVIVACWKYLERGRGASGNTSVLHSEVEGSTPSVSTNQDQLLSQPGPMNIFAGGRGMMPKMNPAMEKFMSLGAADTAQNGEGMLQPSGGSALDAYRESAPANPCPRIGYDHPDGQGRRCRLVKGHKGNCSPGDKVDA